MTVFEIQVDPERNAVIRRALAKRIVHQRELEEEEASTEEDESFLSNSIMIARKGEGKPTKKDQQHQHHHHHHHYHIQHKDHEHQRATSAETGSPGLIGGRMNVKGRWKSDYLQATSSSPSGSFISTISEILPELLPEILPNTMLKNGDKQRTSKLSTDNTLSDTMTSTSPGTDAADTSPPEAMCIDNAEANTLTTLIETTSLLEAKDDAISCSSVLPANKDSKDNELDSVEQDILSKLEDLKKEKSRLFSMFRIALQKKDDKNLGLSSPPISLAPLVPEEATITTAISVSAPLPTVIEGARSVTGVKRSKEANGGTASTVDTKTEHETKRHGDSRKSSDQEHHDKKVESPRPNYKRREHERVIDRSKLNLEIPRKPSLSSTSSNSTVSTPTLTNAAFSLHHSHQQPPSASSTSSSSSFVHKGKRHRSNSPSISEVSTASRGGGGRLGAGSYGLSGFYQDSVSSSNKYPRADYIGSHSRNFSNGNSGGSNGYSNLPEKPHTRHHHHLPSSSSSGPRGIGGDGYHGDDGYYRGKGSGGSLFSSMASSGGGPYRHNGPLGYQPPPTRIGFSSGGSGGNNGPGSSNGGRSSYHGGSGDGMPFSKLAPPSGRSTPFNRSMMSMPHPRGMIPGGRTAGFNHGGGGGDIRNGGPSDRPMSSGRSGDWSRRRSRV